MCCRADIGESNRADCSRRSRAQRGLVVRANVKDGMSRVRRADVWPRRAQSIFSETRMVTGVDISDIAIERAKARNIQNARFENSDFLKISFDGYDVITAIECLYYLAPENQEVFFEKVAREHGGKIMILSGPIIGENEHRKYFTHQSLLESFARHGMD